MLYYMISPIIGAIVGYFTNWLAIKMLFRPHEEKKFLGFKVPFTPGLVFKQRYKISNKIGSVTEKYILTDDTISKYISSDDNKEKALFILNQKLTEIEKNNYSIEQLCNICGCNENLKGYVEEKITDCIYNIINNKDVEDYIIKICNESVIKFIDEIDDKLEIKSIIENCYRNAIKKGIDYFYSDEFKKYLDEKLLNKNINEVIKKNDFDNAIQKINDSSTSLIEKVADLLEENAYINLKLNELTKKVIDENVNGFAGLFINSDKIYLSVRNGLIDYLRSQEGQAVIKDKISQFLVNGYDKKFIELIEILPSDLRDNIKEKINNRNKVDEKAETLFELVCENTNINDIKIKESLEKYFPNYVENINKIITSLWQDKIKVSIIEKSEQFSNKITEKIMNFKTKNICNAIKNVLNNKDKFDKIWNLITDKGATKLIQKANISKIVEDRINSFDMDLIEEITFSVVKRELNAITYVGGVLGFIIGFVPVLIKVLGIE